MTWGIEGLAWNNELDQSNSSLRSWEIETLSQLAKGTEIKLCHLEQTRAKLGDRQLSRWVERSRNIMQGNLNPSIEAHLSSFPVLLPWGPLRPYSPFLEYCDIFPFQIFSNPSYWRKNVQWDVIMVFLIYIFYIYFYIFIFIYIFNKVRAGNSV